MLSFLKHQVIIASSMLYIVSVLVTELCSNYLALVSTLVFVRMYRRLVNVLLGVWYSVCVWFFNGFCVISVLNK